MESFQIQSVSLHYINEMNVKLFYLPCFLAIPSLVLCSFSSFVPTNIQKSQIPPNEFLALQIFYNVTSGPAWLPADIAPEIDCKPWDSTASSYTCPTDYSQWCGLTCNFQFHITGISFYHYIPTGRLPATLALLTYLDQLIIGNSFISGQLPEELCLLTKLETLYLDNNKLTGPLPSCIGNLTSLDQIHMENNALNGPIPSGIGLLTDLISIVMFGNQLSGFIPQGVINLRKLRHLDFQGNLLSGPIPASIGELPMILFVDLSSNIYLNGSIPESIFLSTTLQQIMLNGNDLSGAIPNPVGMSASSLLYLDLSHNSLSGVLPEHLTQLSNLKYLDISYNYFDATPSPSLTAFCDQINAKQGGYCALGPQEISSSSVTAIASKDDTVIPFNAVIVIIAIAFTAGVYVLYSVCKRIRDRLLLSNRNSETAEPIRQRSDDSNSTLSSIEDAFMYVAQYLSAVHLLCLRSRRQSSDSSNDGVTEPLVDRSDDDSDATSLVIDETPYSSRQPSSERNDFSQASYARGEP